jgi:hypothetical protein
MSSLKHSERLVCKLEAKYGGKIDRKIRPLIIVLQTLGFPTSGSCEGHIEPNPYPWVLFVRHIKKPSKKTLEDTKKKTVQDIRRLYTFLGEFYSNRVCNPDEELDIEFDLRNSPFSSYMLRPKGAKILEFTPYELLSKRTRSSILKRYQTEIIDFASFLETKVN